MAAYRYWRVNITRSVFAGAVVEGARQVDFTFVSFLSRVGALSPAMTGDNTPTPLVAMASSFYSGSYPAWAAFDPSLSDNNRWISTSATTPAEWVQIDFGQSLEFVAVALATGSSGASYHPLDFQILASATGDFAGEEAVLLSVADSMTGWQGQTPRTFQWAPFAVPLGMVLPGLAQLARRAPLDFAGQPPVVLPGMSEAIKPLAHGPGRVAGTLKVLSAPAARAVRLHDRRTGQLLRHTVSASNGTYSFESLQLGRPYLVVGLDDTGQPAMYNAAVADMVEAGQ